MTTLTSDEVTLYESQKVCHICKGGFCYAKNKKIEFKLYHEVRDRCHYSGKFTDAAHNICNLRYKVPPPRWNSPCRGEGAYPLRSSNQRINKWSLSERCGYVR